MLSTRLSSGTGILGVGDLVQLRATLRGEAIVPGDPGYDDARAIWNGAFDRHPAVIVRCADAADVQRAIAFARTEGLPIAVRGGGHNMAGSSMVDDGLVIDLSGMKGITVDPEARVARAEPGLLLGDLDRATQAFGLAAPAGTVSHTGIAGLTLGGGVGWLARKHGLTIDNLLAVEIVTADGRLLTASADENADLFWAVRGGGNFGVVTAFTYRLHPVGPIVLAGPVIHRLDQAAPALRFFADFMGTAPDELGAMALFITVPPAPPFAEHLWGTQVVLLDICYAGDIEEGARLVAPLRAFGIPAQDLIGPLPYTVRQSMIDASVPHGMHYYAKGGNLRTLDDATFATLLAHAAEAPMPTDAILLGWMGGAMARVDAEATAFGERTAPVFFEIVSSCPPDQMESFTRNREWARELAASLAIASTGSVYVNSLGDEGQERVRAAYGAAKYERLAALKATYDPENIFRGNQNIRPAR